MGVTKFLRFMRSKDIYIVTRFDTEAKNRLANWKVLNAAKATPTFARKCQQTSDDAAVIN
jgi:hypothetical protein